MELEDGEGGGWCGGDALAVALGGGLDVDVKQMTGAPQVIVEGRLPGIDAEIGEVGHLPYASTHRTGGEGDAATTLGITVYIIYVAVVGHYPRAGDGDHLGASAREGERGGTATHRLHAPCTAVVTHKAEPWHGILLLAPIGGHGSLIDQLGILRNMPCNLGLGHGDGEAIGGAVTALPGGTTVAGAGIAEVVVSLNEPSLAPHPREVDGAVAVGTQLPVGVALTLAVDKDIVDAGPPAGGAVVTVHHHIALAGIS